MFSTSHSCCNMMHDSTQKEIYCTHWFTCRDWGIPLPAICKLESWRNMASSCWKTCDPEWQVSKYVHNIWTSLHTELIYPFSLLLLRLLVYKTMSNVLIRGIFILRIPGLISSRHTLIDSPKSSVWLLNECISLVSKTP